MSRVILSPDAVADLKEIGNYVKQFNAPAAKRLVRMLRRTCKTTWAMFPECGTMCDEVRRGLRCFSRGNHLIFSRGRNPVEVLRIVRGDVGWPTLFK
jgi:plasmid stabilization system protein ParE